MIYFSFIFDCSMKHVGFQFPNQGLNPWPLHWKRGSLTSGPQFIAFSRPEYWSGQPFPSPGYLPSPGIEPRSPALQVDSLPAEAQGKPKNTGVGSLSLRQRIFLTQESNQGLLHCRWILYQLSYQGRSPSKLIVTYNYEELSVLFTFKNILFNQRESLRCVHTCVHTHINVCVYICRYMWKINLF